MIDREEDEEWEGVPVAIQFGFPSPELIHEYSVVNVTKHSVKTKKLPTDGGVDDLSLGSSNRNIPCKTCSYGLQKCTGHFGSIKLAIPVSHPDKLKYQLSVHRVTCIHCSKFLLPLPLLPESDPRSTSWNHSAQVTNLKYAKIMKKFKGSELLRELARLCSKKLMSCGVPTEEISPEVLLKPSTGDEKKESPVIVSSASHFTPEQISKTKKNVQGKKNNKSQKYLTFGEPTAISNSAKNSAELLKNKIKHGDPRLKKKVRVERKAKKTRKSKKGSEPPLQELGSNSTDSIDSVAEMSRDSSDREEEEKWIQKGEEEVIGKNWTQHILVQSTHCGMYQPHYINCKVYIKASFKWLQDRGLQASCYHVDINSQYLYDTLDAISDRDTQLMGLHPQFSHPRTLMVKYLPVSPPCIRPWRDQNEDEGMRGQDDLTFALGFIIKANERLKQALKEQQQQQQQEKQPSSVSDADWADIDWIEEKDRVIQPLLKEKEVSEDTEIGKVLRRARSRKAILSIKELELLLHYYVAVLFNNNIPKVPKLRLRTGDPTRCLRSRLASKKGRFRETILGKRGGQSARNVINGDAHLHITQLSIPESYAKVFHRKILVTKLNFNMCISLLRRGRNDYPGCNAVIHQKVKYDTRFIDCATFKIEIGDVIFAHLQDGDLVIFNRQPSLHRCSIMLHRVKVEDTATFNFHYGDCGPYNADFDGDEMNLHVVQDLEAEAESGLMEVSHQILSPKNGRPLIGFIQDPVLGCWLLTHPTTLLSRNEAMEFIIQAFAAPDISKLKSVTPSLQTLTLGPPHQIVEDRPYWRGLDLLNLLIPHGLHIHHKGFKIFQGKIQEEQRLGSDQLQQIVFAIIQQYGDRIAADFITAATLSLEWYLFYRGTTVSLDQCLNPCPVETQKIVSESIVKVNDIIAHARTLHYLEPVLPSFVEEAAIRILDQGRAKSGRLILDHFGCQFRHGPMEMVKGKSKGNDMHLVQISGLLGQQNTGGRMSQSNSIYSEIEKEIFNVETQGMITSNFTQGLNPVNYIEHSAGGRVGVVDTAVKTSDNGYIQRRVDKATESLSTSVDGTTRTAGGSIVEWKYGDDGFHPQFVEWLPLRMLDDSDTTLHQTYNWGAEAPFLLAQEFQHLWQCRCSIRKVRRTVSPNKWNNQISSPVNLEMIFAKIGRKTNSSFTVSPEALVSQVDEALTYWIQSGILSFHMDHLLPPHWWKRSSSFSPGALWLSLPFMAYLYQWFNSKPIVQEWGWGVEELALALRTTEVFLFRGKMGIFQQVGTIASQSVTEPITTMTLTTFYTAGLQNGCTQDLRRMNEIINLLSTDSMAFASMQLPIRSDFCQLLLQTEKEVAEDVALRMPAIYFKELVSTQEAALEIVHKSQGILEEDASLFLEYWTLFGPNSVYPPPIYDPELQVEKAYNWSIRFVLDKERCIHRKLTPESLALRILDAKYHLENELHFLCSHPLEERWVIYIQLALPIVFENNPSETRGRLWLWGERILSTLLVDGVRSIKSAKATEIDTYRYNSAGQPIQENQKKWIVETHGSDLGMLWQFPEVLWSHANTNSITDVLQELGLEVAQITIAQQLEELLYHNNINVDGRHLCLLAAFMTHYGTALPLTRFGFTDKSPLEKITFEEPFPNLLHESLNGNRDLLKGIIENITIGNVLPMGINRIAKPVNIHDQTPTIQHRLHLLQETLLHSRRHLPRVWPNVPPEFHFKLHQLTVRAYSTCPSVQKVKDFFQARQKEMKQPSQDHQLLRFSSTLFTKWRIASYEYIFSQLKLPNRTYAFYQSFSIPCSSFPLTQVVPSPSPSLSPCLPEFKVTSDSWSYLPTFKPSSEDFKLLTTTDTTSTTTVTLRKRKTFLPLSSTFCPTDILETHDHYLEQIPFFLGCS